MLIRTARFPGVVTGDPLNADTLNAKLAGPLQQTATNFSIAATECPLLWNPTSAAVQVHTITTGDTVQSIAQPGIVKVDLSQVTGTQKVLLSLDAPGLYLVYGVGRDENPEATIWALANQGVNNTLAANIPNEANTDKIVRLNEVCNLIARLNDGRLICRDLFTSGYILDHLATIGPALDSLEQGAAQYSAYDVPLTTVETMSADAARDAQYQTELDAFQEDRLHFLRHSLKGQFFSDNGQSPSQESNNFRGDAFFRGSKVELTDLVSATPTVDLPVTADFQKFIVVVPAAAQAQELKMRLMPGPHLSTYAFEDCAYSVRVVGVRQIPFDIEIQTLFPTQAAFPASFGEELTIYRRLGTIGILKRSY